MVFPEHLVHTCWPGRNFYSGYPRGRGIVQDELRGSCRDKNVEIRSIGNLILVKIRQRR